MGKSSRGSDLKKSEIFGTPEDEGKAKKENMKKKEGPKGTDIKTRNDNPENKGAGPNWEKKQKKGDARDCSRPSR